MSYAKTFANVKFSICTGKERVFSVKGCVLSKQVVNLTLASLCVRVKVLPSSDQVCQNLIPPGTRFVAGLCVPGRGPRCVMLVPHVRWRTGA